MQRPSIGGNPCRSEESTVASGCAGPGECMRAAEEVCRQLRPAQSNRLATSHSELNFKITTPMGVWLSKVSRVEVLQWVCA